MRSTDLVKNRNNLPKGRRRRDTKTEPSTPSENEPTTFNAKQKGVIVNKDQRVTTFRPNHHIFGPPTSITPPPPRDLADKVPSHDSALKDKPMSTSKSFLVKPAIDTRARLVKSHKQPQVESAIRTSAVPPDDAGGGGGKGGDRGGTNDDEGGRAWNLATKVMRNGVEVIVATDKSTLPGEPEVLRVLPSSLSRPITLSPSTLTDQMLLLLPSQVEQELAGAPIITRTVTTAYEYPVGGGEEKVNSTTFVTNVETLGDISAPVPRTTLIILLSASPTFDTSVYSTTYTYLTTLHNEDIPLVLTSRRTLSNTVTAAADALGPAIDRTPPSTQTLELVRGDNVVTQVLVVESDAPRPIITAPPIVEPSFNSIVSTDAIEPSTVEVVKTYFVTYTYYSTFAEGDSTVVRSNVAVSKDVVTETFMKKPKRTSALRLETTAAPLLPSPLSPQFLTVPFTEESTLATSDPDKLSPSESNLVPKPAILEASSPHIAATKTYVTTFTYFTTMLDPAASTVVSSRTRVVQNVVTENSGNVLEVLQSPTHLESMEVTSGSTMATPALPAVVTSTSNNINDKVITGSTIIFFDNDSEADVPADSVDGDSVPAGAEEIPAFSVISTPSILPSTNKKKVITSSSSLRRRPTHSASKNKVKNTAHNHRPAASVETTALPYRTSILASRTVTPAGATLFPGEKVLIVARPGSGGEVLVPLSDKRPSGIESLRPAGSLGGLTSNLGGSSSGSGGVGVGDLLSLGSLGFNMFNAMAGLLSPSKSSEPDSSPQPVHARPAHPVLPLPLSPPPPPGLNVPPSPAAAVSRSPIYIPVGVLAKDSLADGSQRVHQGLVKPNGLEGAVPWVDIQQKLKPEHQAPPNFDMSYVPQLAPFSHPPASNDDQGDSEPLAPGLSAGIPIQPGQVITTNSDIIIGKPSVHGPRPPKRPDEVPSGMLPPPLPQLPPPLPQPPPPLPLPIHEERPSGGPDIPHHHKIPTPPVEAPIVIHAPSESDAILSPPPLQPEPAHYMGGVGPTHISVVPQDQSVFVGRPVSQTINVDQPIIQPDTIAGPIIIPGNPKVVPNGLGQHLLVNIQPSQVANVIIPHDSKTALIYSADSLGHGKRGESVEALPHLNKHDQFGSGTSVPRPSSAVSMEVPIPAEGIQVQISAGHAAEHALGDKKHAGQSSTHQQFVEEQQKHEQYFLHHKRHQENLNLQPLKPPAFNHQIRGPEIHRPHIFLQPSFQPEDEQQLQQHLLNHPGHEHEHSYYYVIQHESSEPFDKHSGDQPAPSEQSLVNIDHNKHSNQTPEQEVGTNERPYNVRPPNDQQHSTSGQLVQHQPPSNGNEFDHQPRPTDHEVHVRPHFVKPHKSYHPAYIPLHLGHAPPKPNLPESHFNHHFVQTFAGQPHDHPEDYFQQDLFSQQKPNEKKNQYIPVKHGEGDEGLVPPPPPPPPPVPPPPSSPPPFKPSRHYGPQTGPLLSSQPLADAPVDFMRPPPVPMRTPVVIPLQPADGASDLEGGELDEPIETEGGELIQESNSRPLRPGQIPVEVVVANAKTTPNPPLRVEAPVRSSLIFEQRQPIEVLGMTPPPITTLRPTRRPQPLTKPHPISSPPYKFEVPSVPSQPMMEEAPKQRPPTSPTLSQKSQPPRSSSVSKEPTSITPLRHPIRARPVPAKGDASASGTSHKLYVRPLHENQTLHLTKSSPPNDFIKVTPSPLSTSRQPPTTSSEYPEMRLHQEKKPPLRRERLPATPSSDPLSPIPSHPPVRHQPTTSSPLPSPPPTVSLKTTSKPYLKTLLTSSPRPRPAKPPLVTQTLEEPKLTVPGAEAPARPPTLRAPAIKPTPSGALRRAPSVSLVPPPLPAILPSRPSVSILPTRYVTQTETQYITSTETTVIRTQGEKTTKTSTHTRTMLVTRTHTLTHTTTQVHTSTSTATVHLVDTVTKTQTLVQPTISPSATVSSEFSHTQGTSLVTSLTALPTTSSKEVEMEHEDLDLTDTDEFSDGYKPSGEAYDEIITHPQHENDSIFVIVSDHRNSNKPVLQEDELSTADETNDIKDNNVLLGGVLVASPGPPHTPPHYGSPPLTIGTTDDNSWGPDAAAAAAARGEVCRIVDGEISCVCRPGFTRMFSDRPCTPTFSYNIRIPIERRESDESGKEDSESKLRTAVRDALERALLQSELRDLTHGVRLIGFSNTSESLSGEKYILADFHVQLSSDPAGRQLPTVLLDALIATNFSLGGTEITAARERLQELQVIDFDECSSTSYQDCSENAFCFNLHGTYTCSCRTGFEDISPSQQYPGRMCSELRGCDYCNYRGTCRTRENNSTAQPLGCDCFKWYGGYRCQVNFKVLFLALSIIGVLIFLLAVAWMFTCCWRRLGADNYVQRERGGGRRKRRLAALQAQRGTAFLRYRPPTQEHDARAMILDTSSEGSLDNVPVSSHHHHAPVHPVTGKKSHAPPPPSPPVAPSEPTSETAAAGCEQRDRSLTVMIPRAKYRAVATDAHTMSTFVSGTDKTAVATAASRHEQKLLSYLDNPESTVPRGGTNGGGHEDWPTTGNLISAGYAVSVNVKRGGYIQEVEADAHANCVDTNLNDVRSAPVSQHQQRSVMTSLANATESEARSFDETTIRPPTRCVHIMTDATSRSRSHNGSHHNYDENHTMVERDLGSTFLMPQTHLYQPDRQGSDISNFDSL